MCAGCRKKRLGIGVSAALCHFHGNLFFQVKTLKRLLVFQFLSLLYKLEEWLSFDHNSELPLAFAYSSCHVRNKSLLFWIILQLLVTQNIVSMRNQEKYAGNLQDGFIPLICVYIYLSVSYSVVESHRHVEHWNVPKMALLKQILRPSRGGFFWKIRNGG